MANTFNMERSNNLIGAIGLAIGVAFGIAGGFFPDPVTQRTIYLISSLGVMAGMLVLSIKFMRKGHDLTAAGLVLFAIAEGMMTSCGSAPEDVAMAGFGAGMAVYAPSFWLICSQGSFPMWTRITGLLASLVFLVAGFKIILGETLLSTDALPGAAYGLMSLTLIGWIIALLREKSGQDPVRP
ncbi:MAG: hypothetical protein IPH05_05505 [Flavobacteriales bacterium]|jgi:hypothetical protein|nr:hypothetical protein [Flavobacteriales bacterium]MBK6550833.1 hypothetical protein [Flavobacteriales bacterium]MBK6882389.1 hypothetical protein [Flavobacteriales bacterium]MBK7101397.1 hypothetical protein [Flavobacteriales bacterium]MBK7112104.1 hypothetical protein [Flavobacteriales bacterium]